MIDKIIKCLELLAEPARMIAYSKESWDNEFGEQQEVQTPLGIVKIGLHQFEKMSDKNRTDEIGMIKPTLENPDIVIEKDEDTSDVERSSKYLFVKTFIKFDGSRCIYYESVTVRKEGMDISISSHEIEKVKLKKEILKSKIKYLSNKISKEIGIQQL